MRNPISLAPLWTLAVTGLWLIPLPSGGQTEPSAGAFLLREGVIIEPERAVAFVMRPGGGCEAIDIAQGEPIWVADRASKPLGLDGGRLIVQGEASDRPSWIDILILDARTGETRQAMGIELPAGAWTSIDDGVGGSLVTYATIDSDQLIVGWHTRAREVRGLPPTPQRRVPALPGAAPAPSPYTVVPASEERRRSGASRLDLEQQQAIPLAPAEPTPEPPTPRLVQVPPEEALPDVAGVQYLSADGRHVLASERIADDRTWEKYRWTLFVRESGEKVGVLASPFSTAPFYVWGSRLVYESPASTRLSAYGEMVAKPLELRCADLGDGSERWAHPLRDTAYRGPYPP